MAGSFASFVEHYMVLKVLEALSKGHKDEKPAHGGIAQLVEHLLCKQGVIGSNPFTSTIPKRMGVRSRGQCEK